MIRPEDSDEVGEVGEVGEVCEVCEVGEVGGTVVEMGALDFNSRLTAASSAFNRASSADEVVVGGLK